MCDFITQNSTLPFLEQFTNTVVLDSAKRYLDLIEGKGENGNILRLKLERAFWEIALPCVNATHRVTRFFSVFGLLSQFSGNLQWDTSEPNEAYGDKGNILRWKLERSFVRNFLVICEFIAQSYTYVSCSSPLSLFLRNLRMTSLERIEAYADKQISSVQNLKEAFWETSFWSVSSSHKLIT